MLNLLTKSFFDTSLLFKLKYAVILLILWTVNKSGYNDSLCLYEYTKMIDLKKSDICSERKSSNDFYFSAELTFRKVSVNKTVRHVQEQKRRCRRDIPSACIPSSVKLALFKLNITFYFKCYLHHNCSINLNRNNTQLYSSVKPLRNVLRSVFWFVMFCFFSISAWN